ncbi:multidrug effflux MFS transporter [Marisediminicola senii]|uniref:multidrug effflux MFS transporter n=1 Tax=Marisediminicola senii TaxID=2711233 RepID=UPI001F3960C0|nr:multidrug effflux MFS transporter [Marisediminicola senii]
MTTDTSVVHPGDLLSRRQRIVYIIVLGALVALGPFTIDLYLPAFPVIESDLGVSQAAIQLTLTATTVGFALGQLIVGPLSDKVGRRLPLILATVLHIGASIGVAMAPDILWVGVFRVLQGVGAAAGAVVAMAMVRDLFGGQPLVRMLSRLALVTGLAPILAPVIGSQLLLVLDWRGVFYFLTAYGVLVFLAAVFFIVETLPKERRTEPGHSSAGARYKAIFSDRIFVGVALIGGMSFSGLFAYLSSSPFLFQDVYGLDAQQYGMLFAINSVGIVIGTQTAARLTRVIGPQWILAGSTAVMLVASISIVILDMAGAGLFGILVPLWFFITAVGFGFPMVQVLALVNHGREAGTAASVLGALNFGLAGLISPIVGLFGITDAVPMGIVMASTSAVAVAALWLIVRPRSVPALD